jgi:hypothetical protein
MGFIVPLAIAAEGAIMSGGAALLGSAAAAGTATAAAGTASTLGTLATVASTAGALYGGVTAYQAGQYQAKVLGMQAKYAESQRANDLIAGAQKESRIKMEVARVGGAQRAAEAANGVDVHVGSAVDIADSTQLEGAADVAVTHYQALQQAYGDSMNAWNARAGASAAKAQGKNALIGSVLEAGGTFLSGASSLAKKRFAAQQAGIGYGQGKGYSTSIDSLLGGS